MFPGWLQYSVHPELDPEKPIGLLGVRRCDSKASYDEGEPRQYDQAVPGPLLLKDSFAEIFVGCIQVHGNGPADKKNIKLCTFQKRMRWIWLMRTWMNRSASPDSKSSTDLCEPSEFPKRSTAEPLTMSMEASAQSKLSSLGPLSARSCRKRRRATARWTCNTRVRCRSHETRTLTRRSECDGIHSGSTF